MANPHMKADQGNREPQTQRERRDTIFPPTQFPLNKTQCQYQHDSLWAKSNGGRLNSCQQKVIHYAQLINQENIILLGKSHFSH